MDATLSSSGPSLIIAVVLCLHLFSQEYCTAVLYLDTLVDYRMGKPFFDTDTELCCFLLCLSPTFVFILSAFLISQFVSL